MSRIWTTGFNSIQLVFRIPLGINTDPDPANYLKDQDPGFAITLKAIFFSSYSSFKYQYILAQKAMCIFCKDG